MKLEKKYYTVQDQETLKLLHQHILDSDVIAVDTETTGLNPRKDRIIGWSDTLINCLKIFNEVLKNFSPNKKRMYQLADTGYITATDLADYLVKNHSMSFRKAYQKTSEIVNFAEKKKKNLNELTIEDLKKIEPKLTSEVLKVFDLKNSVNSKKSYGGTSFENIKRMILKYKKHI